MTDDEQLNSLYAGRCPDCGAREFWPGPRGGAAMNVECVKCGSRFNVTLVGPTPFVVAVFCHRIDGDAQWPPAKHPITWGPQA
jgi:DNA-directed RNA polymerase subunit RPC12/RpoP